MNSKIIAIIRGLESDRPVLLVAVVEVSKVFIVGKLWCVDKISCDRSCADYLCLCIVEDDLELGRARFVLDDGTTNFSTTAPLLSLSITTENYQKIVLK